MWSSRVVIRPVRITPQSVQRHWPSTGSGEHVHRQTPTTCRNSLVIIRHASHGSAGRANGPKNGPGKRLGAKKSGGTYVIPGNIIFRQRGTKWHPGENVGMGRDHTIFARNYGYVRYYRNPAVHPKRRYIGLVFNRDQNLPTPDNEPRRRRFGLAAVARTPDPQPPMPAPDGGIAGTPGMSIRELAKKYNVDAEVVREAQRKRKEGLVPVEELHQMRNYGYREANWQIGRAAERAGIEVPMYDKHNRWAEWRRKTRERQKTAKLSVVQRKKGKRRAR